MTSFQGRERNGGAELKKKRQHRPLFPYWSLRRCTKIKPQIQSDEVLEKGRIVQWHVFEAFDEMLSIHV